jgi:hypothetical protein
VAGTHIKDLDTDVKSALHVLFDKEILSALQKRAEKEGVPVNEALTSILHEVLQVPSKSFKQSILDIPVGGDDEAFERQSNVPRKISL